MMRNEETGSYQELKYFGMNFAVHHNWNQPSFTLDAIIFTLHCASVHGGVNDYPCERLSM